MFIWCMLSLQLGPRFPAGPGSSQDIWVGCVADETRHLLLDTRASLSNTRSDVRLGVSHQNLFQRRVLGCVTMPTP